MQVVAGLAQESPRQLAYLGELGVPTGVDELALEFEDRYLPARTLLDGLGISEQVIEGLAKLDLQLAEMSGAGNELLWTPQALSESVEWSRVRTLARQSLGEG